jgi:HEAT repeat protein
MTLRSLLFIVEMYEVRDGKLIETKGSEEMLAVNFDQRVEIANRMNTLPLELVVQPDINLYKLLADLSPDTPWGKRKLAALNLGNMRSPEALPGLLNALMTDPFWMVRFAIIQALEMIGSPEAIPTLQDAAMNDSFRAVRSYATKAIERLSQD